MGASEAALVGMLREAAQIIAAALPILDRGEYLLEECTYYYGRGAAEPSPAEWGVSAQFVETAERGVMEQFHTAVNAFHEQNLSEHDPEDNDSYLTVYNRAAALLAKIKEHTDG